MLILQKGKRKMSKCQYPLIVVMGLDPARHKIPALLGHHLKKIGKDFVIMFDDTPPEKYSKVLKDVGFVPQDKNLQKPESKIITDI